MSGLRKPWLIACLFVVPVVLGMSAPLPALADRAPIVTAPQTWGVPEGQNLTFTVTAFDPDGQAIASLTAASSPATTGSSFTANAGNTSGTFNWTPSLTQAGTYTVTFSATSAAPALTGTASTVITVGGPDRAPVVTAPATQSGTEGVPLIFTVTATDPDGHAIASLTAASSPATTGSALTPNASNTSGTFSWTPNLTQAGTYSVTFTASNALSGAAATVITVNDSGEGRPVVTAPATQTGQEGNNLTFTVTATDPDGDAIDLLTAASSPATTGSTFTPNATWTSGTFSWTPSLTQAGTYSVTFTASNALSGTARTVITVDEPGDRPPVVTAPATRVAFEASTLSFTVSATDPDGQAIASLTAASSPATTGGLFTANASNTSGTFNWTPSFTQQGTYTVTFTASNALLGTARTVITVNQVDRAPVVTAPTLQSVREGFNLTFTVTAAEPDGDAIASLTAASSPATTGSTFTTGAGNTSGTFIWTPSFTQAGTYSVTFTASNALSGTARTVITVGGPDRAPVVTAPATQSVNEGQNLTFTVTAMDPDGDTISSLTAASSPATTGSVFTPNASNTSGTFSWTPNFTQCGNYTVTFTAANALTGTARTVITVNDSGRPPLVTAPATVSGAENTLITFTVTATDPAGQTVRSLTAASSPATTGSTFTAGPGNASGTFSWTPTSAQVGSYNVTFTACVDACPSVVCASASTLITVRGPDRAPVVTAPATLSGAENSPITFTVTAADPDGDAIATLTASGLPSGAAFSVNASYTSGTFSWTPSFSQAGNYTVTFTASNVLSGSAMTTIGVSDAALPARAFTNSANRVIRLASGKPLWCVAIEPVDGSFSVMDIVLSSVVLLSSGTGSVAQIPASVAKSVLVGDVDRNDIEDITFCFRKEDLRLLFSNVSGRVTVDVDVAGTLVTADDFSARLSVEVIGGGGLAAAVYPNPLNPVGTLTFVKTRSGYATVAVYDLSGRLVRTLLDDRSARAGYRDVSIDGRDARGGPLSSGIYFYRIETDEGTASGRFAVLK